jgi:hypothetical protein
MTSATQARATEIAARSAYRELAEDHRRQLGRTQPHKGRFGPECLCGQPVGRALRGSHGMQARHKSLF